MKDLDPHPKSDSGGSDAATGALWRLTSHVSRIAGLAKGCGDAVEIAGQGANIPGIVRVFREIEALADSLLPPTALPSAPEPSQDPRTNNENL